MKISIVIGELNSIAEANALLAKLEGKAPAGNVVQMPKAVAAAASAAANKPAAVKPQAEKPQAEKPAGKLNYETDVKPTALKLSRNPALRPKLIAIYEEMGVSVGSELKTEQLAEALEKMQAALAEAGA